MNRLGLALILVAGCADTEGVPRADAGHVDTSVPSDASRSDASIVPRDAGIVESGTFQDSGSPAWPATSVSFVPSDQTTNVDVTKLGLSVGQLSPQQTPAESLAALAPSLELVRWPSKERVDATVTYDAGVPAYGAQVALTPATALSDGWYALRLNPLPPRVQTAYFGSELLEGVWTSRFRVGSEPLLQRLDLCDKGDAKTKILVSFSEPLRATKPLDELVTVLTQTEVDCQLTTPQVGGFAGLELLCGDLSKASVVQLNFAGLESLSGVALTDFAGGPPQFSFAPSNLIEAGGCRLYIPWRYLTP